MCYLFTRDTNYLIQAIRGGKLIPLKSVVDEAVKMVPSVQKVFVMDRTGAVQLTSDKDVPLESVRFFLTFQQAFS